MTDEELLTGFAATRSGDLFAQIVRRFWGVMCRAASNVLHNYHDAEDAAQNALALISKNASQFDGRNKAVTWVWQIAVNSAIDLQRRRTAKRRLCPGQATDFMLEELCVDKAPESQETAEILHQAVANLSDKLRAVVQLVDLNEVPYQDAANQLGIHIGTLKSRRHRAIEILRELLPDDTLITN